MFSPSSGNLKSVAPLGAGAGAAEAAGRASAWAGGFVTGAGSSGAFAAGALGSSVFTLAPAPFSTVKMTCPTFTFCPSLTRISLTVPLTEDGTSTTALSVSSSMTGWPSETLAPSETISRTRSPCSMFSPSSGSLNSVTEHLLLGLRCRRERPARAGPVTRLHERRRSHPHFYILSVCRIRFFRIDSQIFHGLLQHVELDLLNAQQGT